MNQTAGGFFQKEVQTLYISKENIIACNNFKANVMGSSSLTDFQINLPTGHSRIWDPNTSVVLRAANIEMRSCGKLLVVKNDGKFIKESF